MLKKVWPTALVFFCGLGAVMLLPFAGEGAGISPVPTAWAAFSCNADGDDFIRDHRKCDGGNDPDDTDPCNPDPDHANCDSGDTGGLGSAISMDCRLGNTPGDTIMPDSTDWYYDAVDKVNCSIEGPSIPWPIRLGVGGGKGRWATVRQVNIKLGTFESGDYVNTNDDGSAWAPNSGLLSDAYPQLFDDREDPLRLNVRPYRGDPILEDPTQTTGSIHLLDPGESYEMGMRFNVPTGSAGERFTISIASLHYQGNEGFTGIACESGDEKNILLNAPGGPMEDVSVYLWGDGIDDDEFPDGYTVTTGSFKRDTSDNIVVNPDGSPVLESAGSRWAAVCSAMGPNDCGNPQSPSNCNFLGYVKIQFTLDTVVN